MINFNGTIQDSTTVLTSQNRSFLYGDGVFETLKVVDNKILFLEDHYFRLMASMRIVRMQIPMAFTMEYIETQILNLVSSQNIQNSARIRVTVFRNDGGYYLPLENTVSFVIEAKPLEHKNYAIPKPVFEVDLYKDFLVSKHLLSTLKTTSKMVHVTASIFAKENELDSCFLINEDKNVVEAISGNIFMLKDNQLITPPLTQGCLNGVMRKQILKLAKNIDAFELVEKEISPFDLQKADELFITNVIAGIQPVTKYRKKEYRTTTSEMLITELNKIIET